MEPSGHIWITRYPTSASVKDLEQHFRERVKRFLDALTEADADVTITATRRPQERAYLMHYAWMIVHQKVAPADVPAFKPIVPGTNGTVNISWVHPGREAAKSLAASLAGAAAMVRGFGLTHLHVAPSLNSLHIFGRAIDMVISWDGHLIVKNSNGKTVTIKSLPRSGVNRELIHVGLTYGVHHLISAEKDPPHWSTNGH
jgi:hypothetical protein